MKLRMILAVAMVPLFASAQNPAPTPKPTPWTPRGNLNRPQRNFSGKVLKQTPTELLVVWREGKDDAVYFWVKGISATPGALIDGHGNFLGKQTIDGQTLDYYEWKGGSVR